MKALYALIALFFLGFVSYAQEEVPEPPAPPVPTEPTAPPSVPEIDTMKMKFGKTQVLVISNSDEGTKDVDIDIDSEDEPREESRKSEAHWAGIDFGFSILLDENRENNFSDHPYWNNDAAKSQVWNLNLFEHKFNFGTPYVGLTTGLGFSFTSVAFKNNYLIQSTADSVYAVMDTVHNYSKNKLKASYLTIPLMLEFNTSADEDKSFYLAAGVIGGVRLTSKTKRQGEFDGKEFKEKVKGPFNLNPFKLDAAVRLGYADWGVFANYSLLPLFDQGKTVDLYPLTFGLSLNF
ncbi:MAG: outer membrane beta-barrel protein [Crocinitomicaceae bacterium]|nr:PorT family protein [Flavobacteriales bacterium]NQZ37176.1 outer membrane beta-barrel protein [Crocinitomicaceae bacterium]